MQILVTGHKGFIGSNLFNYLKSKGHTVSGWEYEPNIVPSPKNYDCVIHLGAISSTTFTDVDQIMNQNFDFSVDLINYCNDLKVNFQYASSASVYGSTLYFKEDGNLNPQSPYAWSKYLFDRYVSQNKFNISVQGFRYFNVYGPGEEHKGDQASPYTKFIKQAKENGVIKLFENSNHFMRDFISVEDVCAVHEKMLTVPASGIFNVGTGKATSFETVAKAVAKKYNAVIEYIPMPENLKSQYQAYTCANLDKINSVIDLEFTTIEDYINGK